MSHRGCEKPPRPYGLRGSMSGIRLQLHYMLLFRGSCRFNDMTVLTRRFIVSIGAAGLSTKQVTAL